MNVLVIGCSLNADSNSQILARAAADACNALGASAELIDLREHPVPMYDDRSSHESIDLITEKIRAADAIILAVPIYNYDVNAAAKNLIEHVGSAFENKLVAFLCAAGGQGSYMSIMSLANSLMLDFRCLIVPRFVYATGACFVEGKIVNPQISDRVKQMCGEVVRIGTALRRSDR